MRKRFGHLLGSLSVAGLAAMAMLMVSSQLSTQQSWAQPLAQSTTPGASPSRYEYEVASIKPSKPGGNGMLRIGMVNTPGGLTATNITVRMLIRLAYGLEDSQISGGPNWLDSDRYEIDAKMDDAVAADLQKLTPDERNLARQHMLQALLADRFKLTTHRETKELPVYALVIAKSGLKLQEAKPGETYPNGFRSPDGRAGTGMTMTMGGRGGVQSISAQAAPIASLVTVLSTQLGRPVLDKTGLTGKYDFRLEWTPDEGQMLAPPGGVPSGVPAPPPADSSGPSLLTAVEEQLGLKLESAKGPVEILVIDQLERPSEN